MPAQASSIAARSQQHNNDRKHDFFFLLARVEEPLTKDNPVFKSLSQSRWGVLKSTCAHQLHPLPASSDSQRQSSKTTNRKWAKWWVSELRKKHLFILTKWFVDSMLREKMGAELEPDCCFSYRANIVILYLIYTHVILVHNIRDIILGNVNIT